MKKLVLLFFMPLLMLSGFGQRVVVTDDASYTGNSSALLDVHSQNGDLGLLVPQVTLTGNTDNTTISSPANGLLVFHTGGNGLQEGFYFWSSTDSEWKLLYSGNVPDVPGNTVYWVRPTGASYIQPEGNDYIHVYDSGQTYGIYYDGSSNQYGIWSVTGNTTNPTAAVVGFSNVSGNQTYGYLGYNGTYNSGTGFGSLDGMAVYGMVDDPDRAAGFFRTTNNATVASLISYSNVWIASFNYVDNYSSSYNPNTIYGELENTVDPNSAVYQKALMTLSASSCPGNVGITNGAYLQAFGGNQDSYGIVGVGSCSAFGLGVYAYGSSLGLYSNTGGSFKGINFGLGLISKGDLFGGLIKGNIYGAHISGSKYAVYYDGMQYSNDISVQLIDEGTDSRVATFVPVSESVDIILKGKGKLVNGKATILFDKKMSSIISDTEPVYITVTPTSETKGVFVSSVNAKGFTVVENNNGKSTATFNWIAIATRKGYEKVELDKAVIKSDFDSKFNGVYRDIDDKDNPPTEIWWDGSKMNFGKIPPSIKEQRDNYIKSKYMQVQKSNRDN